MTTIRHISIPEQEYQALQAKLAIAEKALDNAKGCLAMLSIQYRNGDAEQCFAETSKALAEIRKP